MSRIPDASDPAAAARAELKALRSTWEYAFAHGAMCDGGTGRPEYITVRERERDLLAILKEHR